MTTYICEQCSIEMKLETSGVVLISVDANGIPILLTNADLHKCPICEREVYAGFAELGMDTSDNLFDPTLRAIKDNSPHLVIYGDEIKSVSHHRYSRGRAPVCVKCKGIMHVTDHACKAISTFLSPPKPYKIYDAKKFECACEHGMVTHEWRAIAEHFQEGFDDLLNEIMDEGNYVYNY